MKRSASELGLSFHIIIIIIIIIIYYYPTPFAMSKIIMHSNIQITSTNIQRYCTVQNKIFNMFGETGNHMTWQLLNKLLFIQLKNLIDRLFFQPIKILYLTHHAPSVMPHISWALFVQICLQNSLSKKLDNILYFDLPCRLTKILHDS